MIDGQEEERENMRAAKQGKHFAVAGTASRFTKHGGPMWQRCTAATRPWRLYKQGAPTIISCPGTKLHTRGSWAALRTSLRPASRHCPPTSPSFPVPPDLETLSSCLGLVLLMIRVGVGRAWPLATLLGFLQDQCGFRV